MPARVRIAIGAAVLAVIAAGVWLRASLHGTSPPLRACETAIVTRGPVTGMLYLPGVLRATRTARIGSEASGRITEVDVAPGDRVVAGQVLARLDDEQQRSGVQGAEAALEDAVAAELRARRSLIGALDLLRLQGLLPDDLSGGSILDGEAGEAQLDLVQAAARASHKAAGLRLARVILAKRAIRAPIAGVVLSREVDPGETILATPSGAPLFVIGSDPAELRLEVDVDERYVASLRPGEARFTAPALGRDELPASVREILPIAGPVRSPVSYTVVLSVPNPQGRLHVGMSALVGLSATSPADALALPAAAVELGEPAAFARQSASIWLTGAQGRPYEKAVEAGVLDDDLVEVRNADLRAGMVAVADRSPTTCVVRPPASPYGSKEP